MIRRFLAWLFGQQPDPGPLFPMEHRDMAPVSGPNGDEEWTARLENIDAKLNEARQHLGETTERRKRLRP
jgi:hypothetical protein